MASPLQLWQELLQEEQLTARIGQTLVLLLIGEVETLQARVGQVRVLARLPELCHVSCVSTINNTSAGHSPP